MTKPRTLLFPRKKMCCACKTEAPQFAHPSKGDAVIVSISPVIYRKGRGKKMLRNAGRVQICDSCLIKALAARRIIDNAEARKLLDALRECISNCYSSLRQEDDATPQPHQQAIASGEIVEMLW